MAVNNVGGIAENYAAAYNNKRTQRAADKKSFANDMEKTAGTKGTGFVLHISNEEDGIAIGSSADRNGSVTVYKPNDFNPENPVYKVKVWDMAGNLIEERMVDISKVNPDNSDYIDMFTYSSHLTDTKECLGAQDAFMGVRFSVGNYFGQSNWLNIIKEMMQMQFETGNIADYVKYKQFCDFLEQ